MKKKNNKQMGKTGQKKNSDYSKRKKKKKRNWRIPSREVQAIVDEDIENTNPHWAFPKTDEITGVSYILKKQKAKINVLGSRGIGAFVNQDVKKNDVVLCSSIPGRKINKRLRGLYLKKGYWFKGRLMFSKYEPCMKANVRIADSSSSVEDFNVKLKGMKDVSLKKKGFGNLQKGTYCVLVADKDISAGSALVLKNYGNKKRFPFGYPEYLNIEKMVWKTFEDSKKILIRAFQKTCERCCENVPSKSMKSHCFKCPIKNSLFQRLLREHGYIEQHTDNIDDLEIELTEDKMEDFM
jgi:hypothetical protein